MSRNNEKEKDSKAGIVAHILISVLFVAIGISLLAFDSSMISTIVYSFSVLAMGILLICFGAFFMIKYFFNKEYIKVSNYGFTMGVILVIIGAVFIFKAEAISVFIDSIVALVAVVLGAIMLQQSFALFHIQRSTWFISLILGVLTIAASIFALMQKITFFDGGIEACVFFIVIGAVSLFSLLLMTLGLRDHKKDSDRIYNRNMEDAPSSNSKIDDSIFAEETVSETESSYTANTVDSDSVFDE